MTRSTLTIGEAIKNRGSLHTLTDDVEVSDALIQEIVQDAVLHSPTAFNSQTSRAVVLLKEEHKKLWDIIYEAAQSKIAPPVFEKVFGPRVKSFRPAYGTVSLVTALTR